MKNDMILIMESWRQTTLLEGVVDLIKNKSLDKETVKKVDNKLSDNEGYQLAKQLFSIIDQESAEESNNLDEGSLDWMRDKYSQALAGGITLKAMLENHPKFGPILKLTPAMLALAYIAANAHSTGAISPSDAATAAEIMIKKGNLDIDSISGIANVTEQRKVDG